MTKRIRKEKVTNNVSEVKKVSEANTTKVSNFAKDKIKSIDYSKSNALIKSIGKVSFEFANVRSAILAYIANDQKLSFANTDDRIKLLRTSKKDRNVYLVLCDLSEFSYKSVKSKDQNKTTVVNVRKAYTIKSVLNACDLYLQTVDVDLNSSLQTAIKHEREINAINKLKASIKRLQNESALISKTIEALNNDQSELKKEYTEKLSLIEKQLKNKSELLSYVSIASNRLQVK